MSFSPIRILIVAAAVASLVSCGKKGKVISRGDMAEIYAEMFVMDQRIADDREALTITETAWPIISRIRTGMQGYSGSPR